MESSDKMGGIGAEIQADEIDKNINKLKSDLGITIRYFAYPFGHSYDGTTIDLLKQRGIRGAFKVVNDCKYMAISNDSNPFELPRKNVTSKSGADLAAEIDKIFN